MNLFCKFASKMHHTESCICIYDIIIIYTCVYIYIFACVHWKQKAMTLCTSLCTHVMMQYI